MAIVAVMIELQHQITSSRTAARKRIAIVQQNCQRSADVWYGTLESAIELGADMVFLQEPPKFHGYSHRGFRLVSKRGGRTMIAIRVGAEFRFEVREDLAVETEGDLAIIDIFIPERVRLINVYNQRVFRQGRQTNIKPAENAKWEEILVGRCVLAGDFNAHSPRWGSKISRDNKYWEDLMDSYGLSYVGDRKPTRFDKIIDLTLASSDVICHSEVVEDEQHSTGSDHEMLHTSLEVAEDEITTVSKRGGRKIQQLLNEITQANATDKPHPAETAWIAAQSRFPSEFSTTEELDRGASEMAEAIHNILEKYAPVARVVAQSKRWWSEEIKEARRQVGISKRRRMVEEWKQAKRELKKMIKKAKKEAWESWLEGAEGPKVWDVLRGCNKQQRSLQIGPLVGEDGRKSGCDQDKRDILAQISFPAQNSFEEVNIESRCEVPRWNLDWDSRVKRVIAKLPKNKAPGPDGVTEDLLRTLEKITPGFLTPLVKGCMEIGYHPKEWRKAWGVPIPKPGKKDYTKAKAFRTISLLNTMAKVAEKVASEALTDYIEKEGRLSEGQFGGRRKRGAVDAVARLMVYVEEEWKKKKVVGALFMDVKGAFPATNTHALAAKLVKYGVPDHIVRWIVSFMDERKVWIEINGEAGEEIAYTSGLPQGSPISPILFNIMMSDLERSVSREGRQNTLGLSFLDDVAWVASGKSPEAVARQLEKCAAETVRWGNGNAVVFEPEKSEAVLFTRKRVGCQAVNIKIGDHMVEMGKNPVRWLGIYLDSELKLKHHQNTWLGKAKRRQAEIRRLCHKRGLPAFSVANLQKSVVQSVATFGIELPGIGSAKSPPTHYIQALQTLLNEQARRTLGVFKTTPEGFLMAESSMKPADAIVTKRRMAFQVRQLARPIQTRPIERVLRQTCIRGLELEAQAEGALRRRIYDERGPQVESVRCRENLGSRGTITILPREIAKSRACEERLPGELKIYTDGSRSEKGYVGAGWCWKPTEEEFSNGLTEYWEETGEGFEGNFAGLGKRCEVFDAELFAIMKALKEASNLRDGKMPTLNRITIFSDAQEALRRLQKDEESPGQALSRSIWKWEESLAGVDIEYVWVPGHEGVPGNEVADEFAKRGAGMLEAHLFDKDSKSQWMTYTLSHLHRKCTDASKAAAEKWVTERLKTHKAFKPRKSWIFRPALKPPWQKDKGEGPISKTSTAAFFQMACGHALTGAHLKRFKLREEDGCGWCNGRTKQTRGHLFGQCPGLRMQYNNLCVKANKIRARKGYKKRYRWEPWMFFRDEGLERAVIEYMRDTGVGFEVKIGK